MAKTFMLALFFWLLYFLYSLYSMQNLMAQAPQAPQVLQADAGAAEEPGTFRLDLSAWGAGNARIYLAGYAESPLSYKSNIGLTAWADYDGKAHALVNLYGNMGNQSLSWGTFSLKKSHLGAHLLYGLLNLDKTKFDLYTKIGAMEVKTTEVKEITDDDAFIAKSRSLVSADTETSEGVLQPVIPNAQIDIKVFDMLTLRSGFSLQDWNKDVSVNSVKDGTYQLQFYDMALALLFAKSFGSLDANKLNASIAYVLDTHKNRQKQDKDFDQLGFSLGYSRQFGMFQLASYYAMTLDSVFYKPRLASSATSYDPKISWSVGLQFALMGGKARATSLVSLGLDLGGNIRADNERQAFQGFAVQLSSKALRLLMGDRYLKPYILARFEYWLPPVSGIVRTDILTHLEFGLSQYLINHDKDTVKLYLTYRMENSGKWKTGSPFRLNNQAVDQWGTAADGPRHSLQAGLEASFTYTLTKSVPR